MNIHKTLESFTNDIDEAKHADIHRAAKKGSYPVTIVVFTKGSDGKGAVVHQESVGTPAAVPAALSVLKKKYSASDYYFTIEDATGASLWNESVEMNEGKIQLKRKYTENYPTVSAGKRAPIRNKIIEAIADGKITEEEFTLMIKELSASSKKWAIKNARYFNVSEDGVSLSKYGIRVLNKIRTINESVSEETNTMIHTTFESFLNENYTELFEAFKSSKLGNLLNLGNSIGYHKGYKGALAKAFYDLSKIKMDQIEDADLLDYDAQAAYKEFRNAKDHVVFFIVDNEKKNDYADSRSTGDTVYPGIIGMSRANDFASPEIGGNKEYKGYGASGIYNVKRAADLADRAIVINMLEVRDLRGDGAAQQRDRVEARSGAIAFQSDRDFKKSNMLRYKEILATKASKLPLDTMVEGAINDLTKHISDAMKSGEKTKYGELKIGEDKKGREIKFTDAANIMSSILTDYERYVRYVADAEKDKENGWGSSYYERESKQYAKSLSDIIKKVKDMDYAW